MKLPERKDIYSVVHVNANKLAVLEAAVVKVGHCNSSNSERSFPVFTLDCCNALLFNESKREAMKVKERNRNGERENSERKSKREKRGGRVN